MSDLKSTKSWHSRGNVDYSVLHEAEAYEA